MLKTRLFIVVVLGLVSFGLLCAQRGGSGWLPSWAEQLGVELEKTPAPTEVFVELKGTVKDSEKASRFLKEASQGDEVTIWHAGNVAWTAKVGNNTAIRPCAVRLALGKAGDQVTLVPDRRTLSLKKTPPPFKGSNFKRSGS